MSLSVTLFLVSPAPPASTIFLDNHPPHTDLLLPPPHLSPLNSVTLSLLHPLLPPNSHGCGSNINLYVDPTCRPPPLGPALTSLAVLDLLHMSLPAPEVPRRVPVNSMSLVRSHPLCRPRTAPMPLSSPRSFPFQGFLPPSAFLRCPHIHSSLVGIDRRTSPLSVPRGLCCVLCPPVPCPSALSSLFSFRLLVSSGSWFLHLVSF